MTALRCASCVLACGLLAFFAAPALHAQVSDTPEVVRKRPPVSPVVAVGFEYLFPTLGHAYANDWGRSVQPLIVTTMGAAIALGAALRDDPDDNTVDLGIGLMIGGRIWGLYSAYQTARDHNKTVAARITVGPACETLGMRVAVRF